MTLTDDLRAQMRACTDGDAPSLDLIERVHTRHRRHRRRTAVAGTSLLAVTALSATALVTALQHSEQVPNLAVAPPTPLGGATEVFARDSGWFGYDVQRRQQGRSTPEPVEQYWVSEDGAFVRTEGGVVAASLPAGSQDVVAEALTYEAAVSLPADPAAVRRQLPRAGSDASDAFASAGRWLARAPIPLAARKGLLTVLRDDAAGPARSVVDSEGRTGELLTQASRGGTCVQYLVDPASARVLEERTLEGAREPGCTGPEVLRSTFLRWTSEPPPGR